MRDDRSQETRVLLFVEVAVFDQSRAKLKLVRRWSPGVLVLESSPYEVGAYGFNGQAQNEAYFLSGVSFGEQHAHSFLAPRQREIGCKRRFFPVWGSAIEGPFSCAACPFIFFPIGDRGRNGDVPP